MKVAIYCRLSEEDRDKQAKTDDSNSIQNQKAMLLQYSIEQGWEVYNIYSDDDYTGADRNRPEFNRLLEDAEKKKFDIVLCKTQSRFTRELELVEKYIHGLFPLWGIRFISIVDNADTANKGNKKSRQINGLVNEWYLEDMSENIRSVLTNRRQNGFHIGSFALYGYQKDPEQKGHLIIDEEAATIVREVFSLFAQGCGKTSIARILNDRGVPNPMEYKRQKGLRYMQAKSKNSTIWKYYTISDMLTNEMYIGNMVQGKYGNESYKTKKSRPRPRSEWIIVENTHEPIISKELWERTQQLIKEKAKPFTTGEVGAFSKKAFCINCGYTMQSCKKDEHRYLKCPTRHYAKDACIGSFIPIRELESIVLQEINRLSSEYLDEEMLEKNIVLNNNLNDEKAHILSDIECHKKKVEEYTKGIRDLYMDKTRGVIGESDFIVLLKGLSEEKENAENLIKIRQSKLDEINSRIIAGDNRKEIIKRYKNMEHLTREIVDVLIDRIYIGRRDPETKQVEVEIHWNF